MLKQAENETKKSDRTPGSRKSVFLILGGLIVVGLTAGYTWLRGLPRD